MLTHLQNKVLLIVSKHLKDKPITGKEISEQIGLMDRQKFKEGADIRSIISALRIKGYPICAIGNGYFYADTYTELTRYIDSFQARIDAQIQACDGLKKSYPNIGREFVSEEQESDEPIRKVRRGNPEVWVVKGSKKNHDVVITNMFYSCTCEAFRFSSKHKCKHTEKVRIAKRDEIKAEQAAAPSLFPLTFKHTNQPN